MDVKYLTKTIDWTKVRRIGDVWVDEDGYVVMSLGSPGLGKSLPMPPGATTINFSELPDLPGDDKHGRTCDCYPCQQSNYRMDRDDPSVGEYER